MPQDQEYTEVDELRYEAQLIHSTRGLMTLKLAAGEVHDEEGFRKALDKLAEELKKVEDKIEAKVK
jgi:hypothetical protein